jgi:multisubunit Na+/H+ antiporter MnhB subunit
MGRHDAVALAADLAFIAILLCGATAVALTFVFIWRPGVALARCDATALLLGACLWAGIRTAAALEDKL